jgi:hypothetical protein
MGKVGLTGSFVGVLLWAAPAWGATAERSSVQVPTGVAAPWSIAGISLRMAPPEVSAAMQASGYQVEHRIMGRSWQGEVANEVSNLRQIRIPAGAEVIRNEDYRKGQERIEVTYLAGGSGAYVSAVNYEINAHAIDAERFRAAVLAKYGRPSLRWDWESLYCSPGESQCSRTGSLVTNQLPTLTVYVASISGRVLQLRQGERADRAYETALLAEAERLFPKKDRPSF